MTGIPPDPLTFEFFNEIGIIDQLSGAMLDAALPKGMTRAQFSVLNHFVRLGLGHESPARLANAFQVTRATMTSTLARMKRNGLVTIRPDPEDGRAKRVALTELGRAMRQRCIATLAPIGERLGQLLPTEDVAELLPRLRTIRMLLDADRDR